MYNSLVMKKIIQVENLKYDYIREGEDQQAEPVHAIKGVSFCVEEGSFIAIIGQNGSGKSTLAKNLNGLFVPSEGVVYVDGWDTADDEHIWDVRQAAGMVFQNPDNQLVSSIVEDDVAFGPENLGVDPALIRERVDEALDAVRMGDFKRKAPHMLSGGQKQRVAIAGVVAMRPRCIVFDEPTAMLDPRGRRDIMKIIHQLNQEGVTVILITHFMDEAVQADRVIIMNNGEILLDGTPAEVFREHDLIRSVNLELPMSVELAVNLRRRGIRIPEDVVTVEDMIAFVTGER